MHVSILANWCIHRWDNLSDSYMCNFIIKVTCAMHKKLKNLMSNLKLMQQQHHHIYHQQQQQQPAAGCCCVVVVGGGGVGDVGDGGGDVVAVVLLLLLLLLLCVITTTTSSPDYTCESDRLSHLVQSGMPMQ